MDTDINLSQVDIDRGIKIMFMGTPEFAAVVLKGLLEKYKVRYVATQPDRPTGRHGEVKPSPVKQLANENVILVIQPEKLRDNYHEVLRLEPDLIITCAYGQIIPREILYYPKYGCINVHASLLPKLRGGAPIHRAIMNGHQKTGITIMYMNEKMDEGDIITQEEIEITNDDTAQTLHDKLSVLGRDLLMKTLPSILDGTATRTPQNHEEVSYGLNIKREDEKIMFSMSKKQIYNIVRGLNSWPGAYCNMDGKILKIWSCYITDEIYPTAFEGQITKIYPDGIGIKVSNGEIVITELQLEGKTKMKANEYLNGLQDKNVLLGKVLS